MAVITLAAVVVVLVKHKVTVLLEVLVVLAEADKEETNKHYEMDTLDLKILEVAEVAVTLLLLHTVVELAAQV